MRRRLETGLPAHTAAREERDELGPEEPAGRLSQIAGVDVVRQETDQRPGKLQVQSRDDERQGGLRDTRSSGKRSRERAQALATCELAGERVEHRLVHRK